MVKIIKKLILSLRKTNLFIGGIILFFLIVFLPPTNAEANEQFATSMNLTYDFLPNGNAKVTHNIHLINRTSTVYAKEYLVELNSNDINNITVYGKKGKLPIEVNQTETRTSVRVNLTEAVAGLNQRTSFTINYIAFGLAQKIGRVWEIIIPVTSEIEKLDEYTVKLDVPKEYGPAIYLSPEKGADNLFWSKKQLEKHAIAAAFGFEQFFDFELTYHLFNAGLTNKIMEIALPPDNNYQKVAILDLEPLPINVIVDNNGNWLAQFKLKPKQSLDIKARGFVNVKSAPVFQSPTDYSIDSLKIYLKNDHFWPLNSVVIKQAAEKLATIEDIYRFTAQHLQYPQSAIGMELTDLFITLARSRGIPAREINGFAYTTNNLLRPVSLEKDILHSWPEYFDGNRKTWIAVDPTWEKTSGGIDYFHKFDLNHFAFVIRDNHSTSLLPAGSYKSNRQSGKDIVVVPSEEEREIKPPTIDFVLKLPEQIISGFTRTSELEIDNFGPTAITNMAIIVNSQQLLTEQNFKIEMLPPFAKKNIFLHLQPLTLNTEMNVPIIINVHNLEKTYQIKIIPFYKSKTFAMIVFGMVIISTLYLKRYFNKNCETI